MSGNVKEKRPLAVRPAGNRGFTLLEVVIAMVLLALTIAAALQLINGGLRSARLSSEYTMATLHAREKMEEMFIFPHPDGGLLPNGFQWTSEVVPYGKVDGVLLQKLTVRVIWGGLRKERKVELVSLKMVPPE